MPGLLVQNGVAVDALAVGHALDVIELQLRTRRQHAWATAVETVGTFLITAYRDGELADATGDYLAQEKLLAGTGGQAVLVASDSLESLRRAYPNYFLDTGTLVEEMHNLLS